MKFFMPICDRKLNCFFKLVLCLSVALHVQAVKPVMVIKDSCGNDIVTPSECFAVKEMNTNKWLTTGTSSGKKWMALSDTTASMFAFKNIVDDTTSSLGCRVQYLLIDGTWSTLSDDRGFFRAASSGIVVVNAKTSFGTRFASMISQNKDFSYSIYSGLGSCDGFGCVGPWITKIKADKNWLESQEKAATIAKYEIYYQKGIDCTKTFTLKVTNLQTCNPTKKLQTGEMSPECKNAKST